jgi:hypothetical protein
MFLLPPLAASANVAAERKVETTNTLITVINFMTFNSDCFPLLNSFAERNIKKEV